MVANSPDIQEILINIYKCIKTCLCLHVYRHMHTSNGFSFHLKQDPNALPPSTRLFLIAPVSLFLLLLTCNDPVSLTVSWSLKQVKFLLTSGPFYMLHALCLKYFCQGTRHSELFLVTLLSIQMAFSNCPLCSFLQPH